MSSLFSTYESPRDKPNKWWRNPTKWHVRPAKTQISLGIRPVWSESSLCAQWVAKGPRFLHADSEDTDQTGRMPRLITDQTGRMPRLIWVFAGRTCHFVGFVVRRLISLTGLKETVSITLKIIEGPRNPTSVKCHLSYFSIGTTELRINLNFSPVIGLRVLWPKTI